MRLLAAPGRELAEHVARAAAREPRWSDVLGALSAPTAIVGAAVAFGYADTLLAVHFVGNVLLLAASFAIQSFAAALVGRVLYRRSARATLLPFALTLVTHEVFFVGVTVLVVVLPLKVGAALGLLLAVACMAWNMFLTYALFRAFDGVAPERGTARRLRAIVGVLLHFGIIAVVVGIYMRAQDLLPYPPGRP
ncbi:MAG: hypothetical protein JWO86_6267 [Myxococcaceae bacterium]|nr:hypothetical protein [Myxococcaceae bacterium]MEA2752829.1 hypothetical protein [Myxococcales bacterium]